MITTARELKYRLEDLTNKWAEKAYYLQTLGGIDNKSAKIIEEIEDESL